MAVLLPPCEKREKVHHGLVVRHYDIKAVGHHVIGRFTIAHGLKVVIGGEIVTVDFEEKLQPGHPGSGSRELSYGCGKVEHDHKFGIGFGRFAVDVNPAGLQSLLQGGELWC